MYEPYEEKKESRVKEFFQRLKERIQKPIKSISSYRFRDNRFPIIVLILAVLAVGGLSYTSRVTYTAKISEAESQLVIQEGQISALEAELGGYKTSLAVCDTNLKNTEGDLTETEADLRETQDRLIVCNTDYTNLINSSSAVQAAYSDLQNQHTQLQASYKNLECSYAKSKDCDYYTVSNLVIQCCGRVDDKFYCGPQFVPTDASSVKRVSEYC